MSRDNWERLVVAVLKRDQIWQLCHQDSITTVSSDFSQRVLSNSWSNVSSSPSPLLPLTNHSVGKDKKNTSASITQKLFSALLWRRKPSYYDIDGGLVGISEDHFGLESFSLRQLLDATDNFSYENILGHGGYGKVYKGRLADGSLVAVKRLRAYTDQIVFDNELEISGIVAHRNVHHLRGFCDTQKERLLVSPYMANGSVASRLRERHESQPPLSWEIRQRVALGAARGLAYLHHECVRGIIHRDIKAANILLDEEFEAAVADFSLAKYTDSYDDDDGKVSGTIGHIAPEYFSTGKCSQKADVFGYGVFLLELVTGQRAFDLGRLAHHGVLLLLDSVKMICEDKNFELMVDQDLGGNYVDEEVEKLLLISMICIQDYPKRRPTMSEVVRMLEDEDGDGLAQRWEYFSSLKAQYNYRFGIGSSPVLTLVMKNYQGLDN